MELLQAEAVFLLVAAPAVLLVGIGKGGFGGGLGLLAVPVMALFVSPVQAAAIMLPILCVMDVFGVRRYWRRWDLPGIRSLIPGATLGIVIGTLTFHFVSPDGIRLVLGVITIGFALLHWFPVRSFSERPGRAETGFWGTVSGFTSFVAHAGGAPAQIVLLRSHLDKTAYVASMTALFAFINYAKLLPYGWLGQLDFRNIALSGVLLPLAPIGMWLGFMLHDRLPQRHFFQALYVVLFLTGLKLTYDGTTGLLA